MQATTGGPRAPDDRRDSQHFVDACRVRVGAEVAFPASGNGRWRQCRSAKRGACTRRIRDATSTRISTTTRRIGARTTRPPRRKPRRSRLADEEDVPTQCAPAQEDARISLADEDAGRAKGPEAAARKGTQAPHRLAQPRWRRLRRRWRCLEASALSAL